MLVFGKMYKKEQESKKRIKKYAFRPYKFETIETFHGCKMMNLLYPQPRSGHRIGADSSNFYCIGGFNPMMAPEMVDMEQDYWLQRAFPLFQEMWRFNFASRTWHRYYNNATLPEEAVSNALVLQGNLLMVYGGTGSPFGFKCSNQLYVCNIRDELPRMMKIKTSGDLPPPMYGQAIIYHNDYLYTIGGTTGTSYTCDIHRLNLCTYEWTEVYSSRESRGRLVGRRDEPTGRYRHEVAFDGDNIFVFGGGTQWLTFELENVPTFSLTKQRWTTNRTIGDRRYGWPEPRKYHGANLITLNGLKQVFITGGTDGEQIFKDLWRLDLKTFEWTYFAKFQMPRELYFHATSTTPDGKLYIFGGILSDTDNNHLRTDMICSAWLCIPKLSEICWDAILFYQPYIVLRDPKELRNAGLPKSYVDRIPPNRCEDFIG